MNEFIEKLIGRLEEERITAYNTYKNYEMKVDLGRAFGAEKAIEIVNQLADEYKDKVIIDGQYCFQTCGATEHCKECNRLCNGSIDYYENYDVLAEEYNNDFCEWKQYDENDIYYTGCEQIHMFIDGSPTDNKYKYCPYCGKKIKIAPYQPKGE